MIDLAAFRDAVFGNEATDQTLAIDSINVSAFGYESDAQNAVSVLEQLFLAARTLSAQYSPTQIATGFWFLLYPANSSFGVALGDESVPRERRACAIMATSFLFTDLFAPVLGHERVSQEKGPTAALATLCHSFWDAFPLSAYHEAKHGCTDACLNVMLLTLHMPQVMCVDSAIFGLESWGPSNRAWTHAALSNFLKAPAVSDPEVLRRARSLMESFAP
jgi:hypothetical protein